jgi:hypothetical protein
MLLSYCREKLLVATTLASSQRSRFSFSPAICLPLSATSAFEQPPQAPTPPPPLPSTCILFILATFHLADVAPSRSTWARIIGTHSSKFWKLGHLMGDNLVTSIESWRVAISKHRVTQMLTCQSETQLQQARYYKPLAR